MHLFHLYPNQKIDSRRIEIVFSNLVNIRHEKRIRLLSKFSVNDVLVLTLEIQNE
jgi:hypothetical protein